MGRRRKGDGGFSGGNRRRILEIDVSQLRRENEAADAVIRAQAGKLAGRVAVGVGTCACIGGLSGRCLRVA